MTTEHATGLLADGLLDVDVEDALGAARRHGRNWDWEAAEAAIARAYRFLGAEPPAATGYDWHCGTHPLSIAIAAHRRRIEAM